MSRKLVFVLSLWLVAALVAPTLPAQRAAAAEPVKLRLGLLPILDTLPFYVAEEAGYFAEAGIEVEAVPVNSALERDQLLLAGEIDGMVNDLISTAIFNQNEPRIQIVAQARRAYEDAPQFRILAAPGSGLSTPQDLAGVEIAVSENTIIHYIAQRILEHEGLSADELVFRPEPNIPVRYQLLMEGALKAACLPDPLAQAAIENGAILIADDSALWELGYSQSVLSFRVEVIEAHPEAVEAFLGAWMQAAQDINEDPNAYRALWLEHTRVPENVKDTYTLPTFPTYANVEPQEWDDATAWMLEHDIIEQAPAYADSVTFRFLEAIFPQEWTGGLLTGDPANGEALFSSLGCSGCHALTPDTVLVGPSLVGVGERAAERVDGMDAPAYLRQSLTDPSAYVVEGFTPVMPSFAHLENAEIEDLIAFLMAQ